MAFPDGFPRDERLSVAGGESATTLALNCAFDASDASDASELLVEAVVVGSRTAFLIEKGLAYLSGATNFLGLASFAVLASSVAAKQQIGQASIS